MKTTLAILAFGAMLGVSSAMAASGAGGPCDTKEGRDDGQRTCQSGLTCTGPFEGMYGAGNCQAAVQVSGSGGPCDTKSGRDGGQRVCSSGLTCTGPHEGMYGAGNCQ